jgi:hypothetical protein
MSIFTLLSSHPIIILLVLVIVLLSYIFYLDHKIVVLTRGASGASLEEIIKKCVASVAKIEERNELMAKHALMLDDRVSHAVRNAQTIRYKAFDTNGSNQSFSIALLNEKGNGVVISTLHIHDRVSTFAKPIENYESIHELTEEELAVIDDARAAHKTKIEE